MYSVLKLEYIGEGNEAEARFYQMCLREAGGPMGYFQFKSAKPWVARITGRDPKYGFARQFVRGQIDYSQANSKGSRGVYLYFTLSPGVYEVYARLSWKRSKRYFVRANDDGTKDEISKEEVLAWLHSLPTSAG